MSCKTGVNFVKCVPTAEVEYIDTLVPLQWKDYLDYSKNMHTVLAVMSALLDVVPFG